MTGAVRCSTRDGLATLVLDAPPMNLMSLEMTAALDARLRKLESDPSVRALLLTGAGDRAFCAGSHVGEFDDYMRPGAVVERKLAAENDTYSRLAAFPCPTVAAVRGVAFGGGLELALCCDLIVADPGARLAFPEVRLGVFPGSGGTVRALRRIGYGRAAQMMMLGDPIDAAQALEWGLVNALAEPDRLDAKAEALARRLAAGPASLTPLKAALRAAADLSEAEAIAAMLPLIDAAFVTEDCREGVDAFRAKRPPAFRGR